MRSPGKRAPGVLMRKLACWRLARSVSTQTSQELRTERTAGAEKSAMCRNHVHKICDLSAQASRSSERLRHRCRRNTDYASRCLALEGHFELGVPVGGINCVCGRDYLEHGELLPRPLAVQALRVGVALAARPERALQQQRTRLPLHLRHRIVEEHQPHRRLAAARLQLLSKARERHL